MTNAERGAILDQVLELVVSKHVDPKSPHRDYSEWRNGVQSERGKIVEGSDGDFEEGLCSALARLRTSHVAFLRAENPGAPAIFSLNAVLGPGSRDGAPVWIVEQIIENGPAAHAGIVPSDVLVEVNGKPVSPPKMPTFPLGLPQQLVLEKWRTRERKRVTVELPRPAKEKGRPPMVVPQLVSSAMLDGGVGYVRGAYFQGIVGLSFIAQFEGAVEDLAQRGAKAFVLDFRGNPGGGLASLRVMSWLKPDKRTPVGFSLTRKAIDKGWTKDQLPCIDRLPQSKWQQALMAFRFKVLNRDRSVALATETLERSRLQGRSVLLFDGNSRSAAEMVAAFATEHRVAQVIGVKTPGEVLGATNFKLRHGYVLRMPIATWSTWSGATVEGVGVQPNLPVSQDPDALTLGVDAQIEAARSAALQL